MFKHLGVILSLLLLIACGRTIPFKNGTIADTQQYNTDYNACVQEAMPLFPIKWFQQPYWVQVPVYRHRTHDGREERYISHYQSHMRFETIDANEVDREAYMKRCIASKGYTYRYLSREELEAAGLN